LKICHTPRICYFCNEDKNPDVEAVHQEGGTCIVADESGISMSKEDFEKYS
jgi:hypothetical protein